MKNKILSLVNFYIKTGAFVLKRPKLFRQTNDVTNEYSAGWNEYRKHLDCAATLDQWLCIPGVENLPSFFNIEGKLKYQTFYSGRYYRAELSRLITEAFPQARSVTEFGCGVGRNLLYLKSHKPFLKVQGYELCKPGVDTGLEAAKKFGMEVEYAQLDYLNDPPDRYLLPKTDIAFTMFSLEQLTQGCEVALKNILARVQFGTIHIEPVPENYPWGLRGILGKIDHWKVGYLSGFDAAVRALDLVGVEVYRLNSSHNPLMFPSAYVLRKRQI
jgi:hypothetical protein